MFGHSQFVHRSITSICIAALTWCAISLPVRAEPEGGVVGTGTAASCNDTAFTNALAGGGNIKKLHPARKTRSACRWCSV